MDPNVRNALYLADTANVSEEDIFGNPELMPKLSAALKTITKRKRVKGKPLVDLIATVQRDGSLPACVQASVPSGSTSTGTTSAPTSTSLSGRNARSAGVRRHSRPPALVDAMATSNEEYAANMEQAYGSVHRPSSSASAATSVSPALSNMGNSNNSGSTDQEFAHHHGWGHNSGYGSQQYGGRQGTPANARSVAGATVANTDRSGRRGNSDILLQDTVLDSPTSSSTTLVAGTSPGGGDRFSPGGSISGGLSPGTKNPLSPVPGGVARMAPSQLQQETRVLSGGVGQSAVPATGVGMVQPSGARSASGGGAGAGGAGHHWGQLQPSPAGRGQPRPQKRLSTTSSAASTDVESLDTSHLLEFDDDDEDEGTLVGSQPYPTVETGNMDAYGYTPPTVSGGGGRGGGAGAGQRAKGGGSGGPSGQPGAYGVSPEDLQELEDALLMDSFGGVMDELLEEENITTNAFPEISNTRSFPDLHNVGASLPPLPRTGPGAGHTLNGQRARSTSAGGGAGSPHMPAPHMFGLSPSHAGSASPVGANATAAAGFPLASSSNGPPRPGTRGMGRPRNQVPPRPYTPGKSSRGSSVPWLSHGLGGGVSPRVGSSPRPPTPSTPHQAATAGGARMAPSPNGRRRGDEAFPESFALPSPNENGLGGPSPKARRVGARAFSERFPGSPQAGLSPRMGFPPHSPRCGGGGSSVAGAAGSFNVARSPLDGGSDRTYFPAPAANAANVFSTASPASAPNRGHRRSSSNSWGSAPRHGGGGEGGVEAAGGAATAMSAGFHAPSTSQNWSVRLGDSKTNLPAGSMSMRHGWGVSSSGEMQNAPPTPSPHGVVASASGADGGSGGGVSTTATAAKGGHGGAHHSMSDQRVAQSSVRVNHGHGVMQRRHSSPIPPLSTFPSVTTTPGPASAAECANGDGAIGAIVHVKKESAPRTQQAQDREDFGVTFGRNSPPGETGSGAGGGWAQPPASVSPMPEQFGSPAATAQDLPETVSIKDGHDWWGQATSAEMPEASAAAVAAVAAAAVPNALASFVDGTEVLNGQVTTTSMRVDL